MIDTPIAGLVNLALRDPTLGDLARRAAANPPELALVGPAGARPFVASALAQDGLLLVVTATGREADDLTAELKGVVGDREHPHLADLVAPELDAHGVFGRRREDVEDAASDCELSALADHVDAGVGQFDKSGDDVLEGDLGPDGQRDRLDADQVRRHRLQQRAHRRDHHPQRRAQPVVVGQREPSQHCEPGGDGVGAG